MSCNWFALEDPFDAPFIRVQEELQLVAQKDGQPRHGNLLVACVDDDKGIIKFHGNINATVPTACAGDFIIAHETGWWVG
jgi:hypothetical protein